MTPFCLDFVSILIYLHNNYTKIFVKNQTTDTINLPAVGFYTATKSKDKTHKSNLSIFQESMERVFAYILWNELNSMTIYPDLPDYSPDMYLHGFSPE